MNTEQTSGNRNFFIINSWGKKDEKESLPIFQGFECKNLAVTPSVSQRCKQGLTYSPIDHFTGPVTEVKWYKQEQKHARLKHMQVRPAGFTIVLIKWEGIIFHGWDELWNKWIERK